MDATTWAQLWNDTELRAYIRAEARRHFSGREDREDAEQEAYAWLCRLPPGMSFDQLCSVSRRAIRSLRRGEARQTGKPPACP